jgi:hypothetical protein
MDNGAALTFRIACSPDSMACHAIQRSRTPTQHRANVQQHLRNHHDRASHILPNRPGRYGWI